MRKTERHSPDICLKLGFSIIKFCILSLDIPYAFSIWEKLTLTCATLNPFPFLAIQRVSFRDLWKKFLTYPRYWATALLTTFSMWELHCTKRARAALWNTCTAAPRPISSCFPFPSLPVLVSQPHHLALRPFDGTGQLRGADLVGFTFSSAFSRLSSDSLLLAAISTTRV